MKNDAFVKTAEMISSLFGLSFEEAVQSLRLVSNDQNAGGAILENELPIEEQIKRMQTRYDTEQMLKVMRNPILLALALMKPAPNSSSPAATP